MTTFSESQFNVQALLVSTILSFLSVHSSIVEKPVLKLLRKQTDQEKQLLLQKHKLKTEQSTVNMADEFAKYSKLQRRINSIDQELEQINTSKPVNNVFVKLCFTYGVRLVLILLLIIMSLYYRHTPVWYLGDKVDLKPLTHLICYPNNANFVSFYFWVMCSAAVAKLIKLN